MFDEIEAGIAKAFPRLLMEMELGRHTRRGIRAECDCEYCQAKTAATHAVGLAASHVSPTALKRAEAGLGSGIVRSYGTCDIKYEDAWVLKHTARERVRKEARAHLFELRNKVS